MSSDQVSLGALRTLAFLFTDIEGSTRLWERMPEAMRESLARHDGILDAAIRHVGGQVVKTTGDGVMAAFGSAREGLAACLAAQLALQAEPWGETGPLRVRMGLHVGEASGDGQDYHGQAVNRAARIMAAGHGGQVLLSASAAALVMDRLPEGASLRDLGEHHLKDMARPERLFQLVHPLLPSTFSPVSAGVIRRRSLPAEPSAFVGREAEVAVVGERVADPGVRLLTLTGPGGIGKTRLAIRVAASLEAGFAAGVVFVDLSAARDAAAVLTAIARELGLADTSQEAQLEQLSSAVGQQELLMLLDNFEQVTAAAPIVGRLLRECPSLTLLVTSREALHVRGEHIHPVPPMNVPGPSRRALGAGDIGDYEAVRLFVERAQAVKPDFQVTDENAPLLADICRRLEGLPLAIELATARLRVFSLEALRERLTSQLRTLGSGARDLPERQQTLRATIDWSYQLLAPGEQRLFEVLSCFAGARLEAVEQVLARLEGRLAEGLPELEPIDALASLVDKSLLRQRDDEPEGEPRFEMLESVREFASERLDARRDLATEARSAHAAYHAAWARREAGELEGPGRERALSRLQDELENLRLAWRRGVGERDLDLLQALKAGLWALHDARGWYRGLSELAGDGVSVIAALPHDPHHATLAVTLRSDQARALTSIHGYTAEVEAAYERLLESLEGVDVTQVYPVLRGLASLYTFRAEHAKGIEMGRQILRLGEEQGDALMQADGHLFLGNGLALIGRLEDGVPVLEAGLRLFDERPDPGMRFRLRNDPRVALLTSLSLIHWWRGRLDRSMECSTRAVETAVALGHPSTMGYALFHAALLRLLRREPDAARDLAVRVLDVAEEHELHIWHAVGTVVLGASAIALGVTDEGMRWVGDGLEQYQGLHTPPIFWPFILRVRAQACLEAGRLEEGLRSVREALAFAPAIPDLHIIHGDLLVASEQGGEAEAFERARETAAGWGARTLELRAMIRLCGLQTSDASLAEARLHALRELVEPADGLDARDLQEAQAILRGVPAT